MILSTNLHVVHYENLVNNWESEIKDILKFLNIEFDNTRFHCTKIDQQKRSTRMKYKLSKNPYNERVTKKIEDAMNSANSVLVTYGYQQLPVHLYRPIVS